MKATINNIYEIITADNTTAVERALLENEDTIRNAIIENETKHNKSAVHVEFKQHDADVEFTCAIIDERMAQLFESNAKEADIHDKVEIYIYRMSDADAESTSEDFAEEHAHEVINMIEYYIANHEHVIEM